MTRPWYARWDISLVSAVIAALVALSACTYASADDGPVYVDYDWPAASAVQARVAQQLRPNDGIVVHLLVGQDLQIPQNTITITATREGTLVVSTDGWLDQVTAEKLLHNAQTITTDPVDQVVMLIRIIHEWQDKNPRPIPPEPPKPPNYTWIWWAGGISGGVLLTSLIVWRVRVKKRIEQGLASRADDPAYWKQVSEDLNRKLGE